MTEDENNTKRERRKGQITPAEWEQIVALWELGTVSSQDLADQFGVSKQAILEGLRKRNAIKGRRANEFRQQTEEAVRTESQQKIIEIKQMKSDYQKYADFITRLTMQELQKLAKRDDSPEKSRMMFAALKTSADIMRTMRDEKYHLYDLHKDNTADKELPEIAVVEYTPEDIEIIKRRFDKVPLFNEDDDIIASTREALMLEDKEE